MDKSQNKSNVDMIRNSEIEMIHRNPLQKELNLNQKKKNKINNNNVGNLLDRTITIENIEVAVVEETEQIESIDDSKSHHMSNDHNNDEDAEEDDVIKKDSTSVQVTTELV